MFKSLNLKPKDLKTLKKFLMIAFACGVVYILLKMLNSKKASTDSIDHMSTGRTLPGTNTNYSNPTKLDQEVQQAASAGGAKPASANIMDPNSAFAKVNGMQGTAQGLPPSCSPQPGLAADQLLPKDMNTSFSQLAPQGEGALAGVNLLQAGYHNGIDSVSSALRNANLQLRSEPPNPTSKVSPWNNTTIQPDLMRVPLEIGCGPQ